MSKLIKNNRLLVGIAGIALFYNLFLVLVIDSYSWNNPFDGFVINTTQIMLMIGSIAISQLTYNLLRTKFKSDLVAKIVAVIAPLFILMVYFLIINVLVGNPISIQLGFNILISQVIPDIKFYGYLVQSNLFFVSGILWFIYYTLIWARFYIASLVFLMINRRKPVDLTSFDQALPDQPSESQNASSQPFSTNQTSNPLPSFCPHCGAAVVGTGSFCSVCGKPLLGSAQVNPINPLLQPDIPSTGFNVLAFFVPMVGLILYAVWSSQYPKKAKAIGKWALIGFISGIIGAILFYSFFFSFYMQFMMTQY